MDIGNLWGLGIAGGGIVAIIIFFINNILNGDKTNLQEIIKKVQKEHETNLNTIEQKQNEIQATIQNKEDLSVKKEIEIKNTMNDASTKIEKILKDESSIKETQQAIDDEWDNL